MDQPFCFCGFDFVFEIKSTTSKTTKLLDFSKIKNIYKTNFRHLLCCYFFLTSLDSKSAALKIPRKSNSIDEWLKLSSDRDILLAALSIEFRLINFIWLCVVYHRSIIIYNASPARHRASAKICTTLAIIAMVLVAGAFIPENVFKKPCVMFYTKTFLYSDVSRSTS